MSEPSNIAIVFDYASAWAWEIQPQGQDFDYFRLVYDLYTQLRKRGYSIDILPPTISDFGERDYVFIPGLMTWNKSLKQALNTFRGKVIIGPRSGSKTENFQIPETLPPNLDGMDTEITATLPSYKKRRSFTSQGGLIKKATPHSLISWV